MLVILDTPDKIIGYRLTEPIYLGKKTLVYRGIREQDQKSVILKLMRNEYPTFREIAQFRNQYTITKNLNLPGIVQPHSLENYRNGYAIVMEDCGSISLKDWRLADKQMGENPVSLSEFFHIAIQIVTTLEGLHRHRIIHKDIKPANILINPTTSEVKIIDFSIASLLPREIQFLTNPNVLEGTLAYISPEQTGRMNRGIDYRTDFYSLGVTFFELLTGLLPFSTTDAMELVYCHIAKEPPKINQINFNIPPILSDIISKLMAKNAEDRYQSASGLKHDLEVCCNQWQETGNITSFELGIQDISDRFVIPEKLYGRQHEVETLLAAFGRVVSGTKEMILVSGFSGIGKTAVVNEVHKPIVRQRSYFIKGKFDQFQRDIPLSGLVQAFRDLIGQILSESDVQIQQWKAKTLLALGTQGQVIADVIPQLERIIGKQPPVTELSGSAAQNRFNLLFQRFIQVFNTKDHPLVIFLDDLQWSDATSLKLIQLLMSETTSSSFPGDMEKIGESKGGLLLIGAYRDNEVFPAHPLSLTLQDIKKTGATVNTITLAPLNQEDLNCLIADTLRCQAAVAVSLTQMVLAKTKGNPFFTNQFLKSLYDDKLLNFNFEVGYWQYDIAELQALSLTDNVVEFMVLQIEKLPKNTQEVLKLAACIGNVFDLKTLAIVQEKSTLDTASDLWAALHEGLVLPQTDTYKVFQECNRESLIIDSQKNKELPILNSQSPRYIFLHDRVQQAAYSLIPENQKKQIHLRIGLLLLSNIPVVEREEKIFELVNQFNIAVEFITHQTKRDELAAMNLIAGRKALASTAYPAAFKYLTTGIELLSDDSWERKYELTLALYEIAAEVAYLAGEFEQTAQLVDVVLARAKTLLEKVKVYEVQIQAYGAQGKALEAVKIALAVLNFLGVDFPDNPTQSDVQLEMAATISNLANRRIEDLIDLPEMTQAQPLAVMRLLSSTTVLVYQAFPNMFLLIVLKQVNFSLKYGNTALSAFAYVVYGLILCGVVGDIEAGYQFGNLALSLLSRFQTKAVTAKVFETFNQLIRPWKEHIRETLKPLLEVYSIALETGDLEFGAYALQTYSYTAYFMGQELVGLEQEIAVHSNFIRHIKQERVFYWTEITRQTALNLLGHVENKFCLIGEAYNEEVMLPLHLEANDGIALLHLYSCKLHLCYLFANYPDALKNSARAEQYLHGGIGKIVIPQFYFYDSLARLAVYPNVEEAEQIAILQKVSVNQEKIRTWAHHAPMNYLHKFYLVEAEQHRVRGQYLEAMDYYDRAISLAKEHEYIHEEALTNELAARFYLAWGKQKIAQTYLIDAYYGYLRWGALAKVDDLQKCYSQLLAPIFQQEQLSPHPNEITTSIVGTSLSSRSNHQTLIGSKTSISDSLDLASVIKASQALSGEIQLELLLSTLMKVVIENAGASKCVLMLSKGDNLDLTVTAVSSSSTFASTYTEFPSIRLEFSDDVPITLINYVKRTREIFVIDDTATVTSLVAEEYILRHQPKSVLCIPIINQGKLLGIVYLENDLTTGAFARDRVELLKLITTQAAISLENAILYNDLAKANKSLEEYSHTLEEKVAKRTAELNQKNQSLQQALQELQRTQTQLIQSEKMSSLGQMVAGIAHEINNPINFIHGNIVHATEYIQDLLDLIALYQQEYLNPSPVVKQKTKEIEINFLVEDLPKILDSMNVGTSRIRDIVLGLRNFSRLDEAEMKLVDIHEGIDNSLMILQHRLKKNRDRPAIEVIKEYEQLPKITCYAGQLNQVFINILSNAIDALEESLVDGKLSVVNDLIKYKLTIYIKTELVDNYTVRIRLADNGSGMTEAVRQKIFDPFFTTKPIGRGTGLGLSISYQVVVDKHKGQLLCNTKPGQGSEFVIEIPLKRI